MKGFVGNIEEMTEENSNFRRVLYTAHQMQLVLMALRPGEEIGEETHKRPDPIFPGGKRNWRSLDRRHQDENQKRHYHHRPGRRAA